LPTTLRDLLSLLDLEAIEDDLFRGRQPDTRLQRVFGGQVAGQALTAAARTVPSERTVHSLHAVFVRPGDPAVPIVYDVSAIREGRSFSTRRTAARQHGNEIFFMTSSFQVPEAGLEHQDVMPEVPAPEMCPPMAEVVETQDGGSGREWEQEWAALEMRYAGGPSADERADQSIENGVTRLWVRAAGQLPDDPVVHGSVLTYASGLALLGSALAPRRPQLTDGTVQAASLDHAMWFRRPQRSVEGLLYDQMSPAASGARGLASGKLFSRDGVLVATVAQEGLIRVRDRN